MQARSQNALKLGKAQCRLGSVGSLRPWGDSTVRTESFPVDLHSRRTILLILLHTIFYGFTVRNVCLGKRGIDFGKFNGYGNVQIWYGLKGNPSGCLLPKTTSPADKNFANGLSLSTCRENS